MGAIELGAEPLPQELVPDLDEAHRFLNILAPDEAITFQTFDDSKGRSSKHLARVFHGTLEQHQGALIELNTQGAGIFLMVNNGDGKVHAGKRTCRTNASVIAVRALFVDLDGAPLEPVLKAGPTPSIVVDSSPGRWHVYWTVTGCPLNAFEKHQRALARKFKSDGTIVDLARVMRLPGFLHRKAEPFLTRMTTPTEIRETK